MTTPTAYKNAGRRAAGEGDFSAAVRLEFSGRGKAVGHHRRERHELRAIEYARRGGLEPFVDYATEEDKALYLEE